MKTWVQPLALLAAATCTYLPQAANAQNYASVADQPNPSLPMAVVDHNVMIGFQPRAWMVTNGGKLVGKATERSTYGWLSTTIDGISSGLGAVSWGANDGWHQRVFYAKADRIQRVDLLDEATQSTALLPNNLTYKFNNTDVAAVGYYESNVFRNAVAAVSTAGKMCVWDGPATGFLGQSCTGDNFAAINGPEVVGATVNGHIMFAYRGAGGQLRRSRRNAGGSFVHETLPLPPGASSITAPLGINPSQITGSLDLVLADNLGRIWLARMRPQLLSIDSWTQLPALPEALATDRSALGVTRHTFRIFAGTITNTRVFARSSSYHLYMLVSDNSGNFNTASWVRQDVPGGQRFFALADVQNLWSGLAYSAPGHAYGVAGDNIWFYGDTTFQEFDGATFRDHLRPMHSLSGLTAGYDNMSTWHQSHDVSVAGYRGGFVFLGATSTRQNTTSPWQVMTSMSLNGGQSFSYDMPLLPIPTATPGATSLFDPDLSIGDDSYMNHVVTQTQITQLGNLHCTTGAGRDVIYRRAGNSNDLAALSALGPNATLLASGDVEHGSVLSTGQGTEQQAHVLYWDHAENNLTYGTITNGALTSSLSPLAAGQGELIRDAAGDVYGYRRSPTAGQPTLCKLWPAGEEDCGTVGLPYDTFLPTPVLVPFGEVNGPDRCNDQGGAQACIDAASSVVIVADPVTPRRFYAAFQHLVNGRSHIFVTRSSGDSLNAWSQPVDVISAMLGTPDFIDPSLSVDANGAVIVSFIQVYRGALDPGTKNVVAVSQDLGTTFTTTFIPPDLKAGQLPFNCASKRYELGSLRKATGAGGRALHSLRISLPPAGNSATIHASYGISPWAVLY